MVGGFSDDDADKWFLRNVARLRAENDYIVEAVAGLGWTGASEVLEVGCANGYRLDALTGRHGGRGFGIDPSGIAIEDGAARYPALDLRVGNASSLPFEDEKFGMVVLGFFLTYLEPRDYFRVVMEADRVLAEGGWLVVQDFFSAVPVRRAYSHKPGAVTRKMDFARLFLAHPGYTHIHRELSKRDAGFLEKPKREGIDVLVKDNHGAFVEID